MIYVPKYRGVLSIAMPTTLAHDDTFALQQLPSLEGKDIARLENELVIQCICRTI